MVAPPGRPATPRRSTRNRDKSNAMIGIDPGEHRDDAGESPSATQSRLSALATEVALRDRELTLLRDTLDAERAQSRAARLLAEEHLKEIEHTAHVQEQLEQAANEMRSAY